MRNENKKKLRWGYSTGACATALVCSAWHYLQRGEILKEILVCFLDGQSKILPLLTPELKDASMLIRIEKDGGDDPDCTDKAILYGYLEESSLEQVECADYVLSIGKDSLILRGIEGIGISTRLGLDCEQGHFAINLGPRKMIAKNLELLGMGSDAREFLGMGSDARVWLFAFGVKDGENIAKHTLNSRLGIEGGISILGTTGHVRPYSHEAYIETVRICVRSHHLNGGKHLVLCTGGRSQTAATKYYANLPQTAFVSMGDFIAESVKSAQEYGMEVVSIACMAGKLCKYAAGFENTHANHVEQDMALLREEITLAMSKDVHNALKKIKNFKSSPSRLNHNNDLWKNARSVREALCYLPDALRDVVLDELAKKALTFFQSVYAHAQYRILLCDFNGDIIFEKFSNGME